MTESPSQLEGLAEAAGFPSNQLNVAQAVAEAESGGNPTAISSTDDYGLWQINKAAHPDLFDKYTWSDPQQNADMAFAVWKAAGDSWDPWTTYKSGAYQKFLNAGVTPSGGGGGESSGSSSAGGGSAPGGGATNAGLFSLPDAIIQFFKDADSFLKLVGEFFQPSTLIRIGAGGAGLILAVAAFWLLGKEAFSDHG